MSLRTVILGTLAAFAVIVAIVWVEVFRYDDCLRVGHSVAYCVIDIFR